MPLGGKAAEILEKIKTDNMSVSVNVRRGDNAHNPSSMKLFGCPGMDYYKSAIDALVKKINEHGGQNGNINLYIFSDEIEWAKENFLTEYPTTFVTQPDIELWEEMALISACRHNIISNTTFGCGATGLNREILKNSRGAAAVGIASPLKTSKDIIPEGWIRT